MRFFICALCTKKPKILMSSNSTAAATSTTTTTAPHCCDLKKFEKLRAHPLITSVKEFDVPHYATLVVNCDCCKKDEPLETYVRSYHQPDVDVCIKCYNEMQTASTSADTIGKALKKWHDESAQQQSVVAQQKKDRDAQRAESGYGYSLDYIGDSFVQRTVYYPINPPIRDSTATKKRKTDDDKAKK